MTTLEYIAQGAELFFGLILIVRLLTLQLHRVYRLLSYFLVTDLLGTVWWVLQRYLPGPAGSLDYRLLWITHQVVLCAILVPTVYALLDAVLRSLPGILNFSHRFLNMTFVVGGLLGLGALAWSSQFATYAEQKDWQDKALFVWLMADQVVSSVVLLSIVSILCFLLWFPLVIAKNLANFVIGFSVFCACNATILFFQSFFVHYTSRWVSTSIEFVMSGCVAYWALTLSRAGERAPARMNIRRNALEERRLLRTLEQLNESLLRSVAD